MPDPDHSEARGATGKPRIKNDGLGHHQRMVDDLLQAMLGIRDQGARVVFCAGKRAGRDDKGNSGRVDVRLERFSISAGLRHQGVKVRGIGDSLLQAHQHRLSGVDDRAAADRDNEVCVDSPR